MQTLMNSEATFLYIVKKITISISQTVINKKGDEKMVKFICLGDVFLIIYKVGKKYKVRLYNLGISFYSDSIVLAYKQIIKLFENAKNQGIKFSLIEEETPIKLVKRKFVYVDNEKVFVDKIKSLIKEVILND